VFTVALVHYAQAIRPCRQRASRTFHDISKHVIRTRCHGDCQRRSFGQHLGARAEVGHHHLLIGPNTYLSPHHLYTLSATSSTAY